jgi:hypothetical protein
MRIEILSLMNRNQCRIAQELEILENGSFALKAIFLGKNVENP